MFTEEVPKDIREDIVNDDDHRGQHKVNEAFVGIAAHRPCRSGDKQSRNDDPSKQSELILQETLLQTQHKAKEPYDEQRERDEVVIDEQSANQRILNPEIWQLRRHESAQT